MASPAKRSRASHEQLSQMVDFMYDNPGFTGRGSLKFYGKLERERIWIELADELNSLGGAKKTFEQWQVVWRDLRKRTSVKVRGKKKTINGRNVRYKEPITELDKRVIAVIGRDYIESHESEKDLEEEDEVSFEMPSTSANASDTHETSQQGTKRLRLEDDDDANDFEHKTNFLEIAGRQADALKVLAESNAASTEVVRKQAEALKTLAECSTTNVKMMESVTQSMKSMIEGIKANADALNNLANAINHVTNIQLISEKRKRSESADSISVEVTESSNIRSQCMEGLNNFIKEDEKLQEPNQNLLITVKSEEDG